MGRVMNQIRRGVVEASPHIDTAGPADIVSFSTDIASPAKSLIVGMKPIQDLHGYDSPWPAGGGANLLDLDKASYNPLAYGLTVARDGDGVRITGTATSSGNLSFNLITNYADDSLSGKGYVLQVFDVTAGYTVGGVWGFRTESERAFAILLNGITNSQAVDCFMRLSVAVASQTAWSPYENLCPISGRTGLTTWRTGKNLLPNLTGARSANSIFIGQTDATTFSTHLMAGVPYTLTFTADGTSPQAYYKENNGNNMLWGNSGTTKTFAEDVDVQMWIYATDITSVTDFQLELGSTASDYSVYSGTTYPITWQSEAGTVYGGTVDVVTGVLTVTHISEMYDGSSDEGWTTSGTGTYVAKAPLMLGGSTPISSAYPMETSPTTGEYKIRPKNNNLDFASVADWKAYLAETPLQVVYELETPQTYQLTPQKIQMLKGANVLWSDSNSVTVKFWTHI